MDKALALAAYERGRLHRALRFVPLGLAFAYVWWRCCGAPLLLSTLCALGLAALGVLVLRRGRALADGVWPGTLLGLAAIGIPFLLASGHAAPAPAWCEGCAEEFGWLCFAAGALISTVFLVLAPRARVFRSLGSTLLFAALAFSWACWILPLLGIGALTAAGAGAAGLTFALVRRFAYS